MTDRIDAELEARFGVLANPTDDSSWTDVRRRARPPRLRGRRRVALALAAAVVVLAAPALALRGGSFFQLFEEADRAPTRVEQSFAAWDATNPPEFGTGVVASGAREVLCIRTRAGADAALWVAPTAGGYCWLLSEGAGACYPDSSPVADLSAEVILRPVPVDQERSVRGSLLVFGEVGRSDAASLALRFSDGTSARVPHVWVSGPINMGFFLYSVRPEDLERRRLPAALVARDGEGNELGRVDRLLRPSLADTFEIAP